MKIENRALEKGLLLLKTINPSTTTENHSLTNDCTKYALD